MNDPHWHFWPGSLLLFEVDEETYINLIFWMQKYLKMSNPWPKKLFLFFSCKLYGLSNYQTGGQTIHPKREQKSHKKKWVYCWQWVEQKFPFLSKAAANTSWSLHGRFPLQDPNIIMNYSCSMINGPGHWEKNLTPHLHVH